MKDFGGQSELDIDESKQFVKNFVLFTIFKFFLFIYKEHKR